MALHDTDLIDFYNKKLGPASLTILPIKHFACWIQVNKRLFDTNSVKYTSEDHDPNRHTSLFPTNLWVCVL